MSTNPYASPVELREPVDRADREVRSVIRTFRMIAIFSIAQSLLFFVSLLQSLWSSTAAGTASVVMAAMFLAMTACALFYLYIAARMSRRVIGALPWARRLSLLMTLSFPVFPMGISCLPIFVVVGVLCYRKVTRHYIDYCQAETT